MMAITASDDARDGMAGIGLFAVMLRMSAVLLVLLAVRGKERKDDKCR